MKNHRIALAFLLAVSLLALCAGCSKPADSAGSSGGSPVAAISLPAGQEAASSASEAAPASARNDALDAAFSAGETLRLAPVDLPSGDLGEGWMPVDLSPDGKTVLWRNTDSEDNCLSLVRDGETIPVVFNADKGVGDPYVKAEYLQKRALRSIPSYEGLSWSADGRYIALSDSYSAMKTVQGLDVSVIDTSTGDLYFAESFRNGKESISDGSFTGVVYVSAVDRSGKYCYYLLYDRNAYRFCRCPVEGGTPEVLCEMPTDERMSYDLNGRIPLREAADGSWIIAGLNGSEIKTRDRSSLRVSLIRFVPSGDTWTTEVTPSIIPYRIWTSASFTRSDASGYGMMILQSPTTQQASSLASSSLTDNTLAMQSVTSSIIHYVNLMRILPGDTMTHDVWWMRRTGENRNDVEMSPGEPFLWSVKMKNGNIMGDELAASVDWIPQLGEDFLPKDYEPMTALRGEDRNAIFCLCLSPDGYYALIYAGGNYWDQKDSFYLVNLETMQVRPVDAPEELCSYDLRSPVFCDKYRPQMSWNEDGTLLILNAEAKKVEAFRLEYGQ